MKINWSRWEIDVGVFALSIYLFFTGLMLTKSTIATIMFFGYVLAVAGPYILIQRIFYHLKNDDRKTRRKRARVTNKVDSTEEE